MESQETWPVSAALSAFAGLALIFALWWWYFDVAGGAAERHVRSQHDMRMFNIWSHAHFPMYLSIAVLGVGIEHVISLPSGARVSLQHASILIGAAIVLMSTLIVIGLTSSHSGSQFRLLPQLVVLAVLLPSPLLAPYSASFILIVQILLVCIVQMWLLAKRPKGSFLHVTARLRGVS
jgi:low temperature requirement protein LtrA